MVASDRKVSYLLLGGRSSKHVGCYLLQVFVVIKCSTGIVRARGEVDDNVAIEWGS